MCHFGAHGGFQAARVPSQPPKASARVRTCAQHVCVRAVCGVPKTEMGCEVVTRTAWSLAKAVKKATRYGLVARLGRR